MDWDKFVEGLDDVELDALQSSLWVRLTAAADVAAALIELTPEEIATAKTEKIRAIQMLRARLPGTRLFVAKRAIDRIPYELGRSDGKYS